MQSFFVALCLSFIYLQGFSQEFKSGDIVEVDLQQSSYGKGNWAVATVTDVNLQGMQYTVKLADGRKVGIPVRNPEKWIRKSSTPPLYGKPNVQTDDEGPVPTGKPRKQANDDGVVPPRSSNVNDDCSPSVANVKNRITQKIATTFSEYELRDIKFSYVRKLSSYKNTDPYFGRVNTIMHPFQVQYTVDLKRKAYDNSIMHKVWNFTSTVVFYFNTKGSCEFGTTQGTAGKLLLSETL